MSIENTTTVEEMNNEQYIAAIEELKASTVSRDAYNKLRNENKQLLDALVSGKEMPQAAEAPKPTVNELRKKLFGDGCENLSAGIPKEIAVFTQSNRVEVEPARCLVLVKAVPSFTSMG